MTRYSGVIGFSNGQVETSPGIFKASYVEHRMKGDDLSQNWQFQDATTINDELSVSNRISVIADRYSYQNASNIRYASYMGQLWKVQSLVIQRPRIVLTLAGVFKHTTKDVIYEK